MTLRSLRTVMSERVPAQRKVTGDTGTPMDRHRFVFGSLIEKREVTPRFHGSWQGSSKDPAPSLGSGIVTMAA